MVVIKRDGREVPFDKEKIQSAISKAFAEVNDPDVAGLSNLIDYIPEKLTTEFERLNRAISVEDIQDSVETELMRLGAYSVAKAYIRYRYEHELLRNSSTLDGKILALVDNVNETVIQENSNKNPQVLSTQRDYVAGEVSRDITNRLLLPDDIRRAHEEGIIHFHDADYFIQHELNCCLVNLEDMLQNGTVINGTLIERPHSFATACNIATQIMAQIASCQYGGQSESLAHLAPFVDVSRQKLRAEVAEEFKSIGEDLIQGDINEIAEQRLKKEIERGIQTIQYQINTLMTTNGQTPFVTIFMYLGEVEDPQTKADLAMIIEEVIRQRMQGVKNPKGVWITPAFPKLIYVLEEDNIHEDSPYWYLTRMCAQCTAKRMVPDYISEKMMLQNKIDKNGEGHCYTCMGCRSFLTPFIDEEGNPKYYGRLTIR